MSKKRPFEILDSSPSKILSISSDHSLSEDLDEPDLPPSFESTTPVSKLGDLISQQGALITKLKGNLDDLYRSTDLGTAARKKVKAISEQFHGLDKYQYDLRDIEHEMRVDIKNHQHNEVNECSSPPSNIEDLFTSMPLHEILELSDDDDDEDPDHVINPSHSSDISTIAPQPPNSAAPSVMTEEYVFEKVFSAIKTLHARNPNHEVFGPIDVLGRRIQCPIGPLPGSSVVTWHNKALQVAKRVRRVMGERIVPGSCWMSSSNEILWQKKANGKSIRYASVTATRLLAFFATPTDENWYHLTAEKYKVEGANSKQSPFCHQCHNGDASKDSKSASYCINGIEHGFFGSPTTNHTMKSCHGLTRQRADCIGHPGLDNVMRFGVYTHPDSGISQHCRNKSYRTSPESCKCQPPCWHA